jgi:hypothetical protein
LPTGGQTIVVVFVNNTNRALRDEIEHRLASAQWAFFAVSFIRDSGIDTLEGPIRAFRTRGGQLSVVFGNDYNAAMRAHGVDADPVRIHGLNGELFSGRIYASTNNQGEYHQMVVNGSSGDALSLLPLGQQVIVQIVKNSAGVEVRIGQHP